MKGSNGQRTPSQQARRWETRGEAYLYDFYGERVEYRVTARHPETLVRTSLTIVPGQASQKFIHPDSGIEAHPWHVRYVNSRNVALKGIKKAIIYIAGTPGKDTKYNGRLSSNIYPHSDILYRQGSASVIVAENEAENRAQETFDLGRLIGLSVELPDTGWQHTIWTPRTEDFIVTPAE